MISRVQAELDDEAITRIAETVAAWRGEVEDGATITNFLEIKATYYSAEFIEAYVQKEAKDNMWTQQEMEDYKYNFLAALQMTEMIPIMIEFTNNAETMHLGPFDIMVKSERMNYHSFLLRVLPMGFTVPRLIHIGDSYPLEKAMQAIKTSGHGAIDEVEGAVWRVERNEKVDYLVKFVRPEKKDGIYLPENNNGITIWNTDLNLWLR